jgi:hypothetical protein
MRTFVNRIEVLEKSIPKKLPLTVQECCKWFLMFAEKQGSAYVNGQPEYTDADWEWFNANGENFIITTDALKKQK